MKTSIYDDMENLHKMVAPFRAEVIRVRNKKMNNGILECIRAFTELANSASDTIVAITHVISALKEKDIKC